MGRISSHRHAIHVDTCCCILCPSVAHTLAQSCQETLSSNSILFWSGDNPVRASDGSERQVHVVQQTGEALPFMYRRGSGGREHGRMG